MAVCFGAGLGSHRWHHLLHTSSLPGFTLLMTPRHLRVYSVAEEVPRQTSWIIQRILKATKYVEKAGFSMTEIHDMKQFSIKQIYLRLGGIFKKLNGED